MKRWTTVCTWLLAGGLAAGLSAAAGGGDTGEGGDCRRCVEDVTGDFMVDVHDVAMVLEHWGCVEGRLSIEDRPPGEVHEGRPVECCRADCDDDGDVDVMDLVAVIMAWGAC